MGGLLSRTEHKEDTEAKTTDRYVSEMKKDKILIQGWKKLATELRLEKDVIYDIERLKISSEDILRSIVEHWRSSTKDPNTSNFCSALRKCKFVMVAEKIEQRKNKMDGQRIQDDVGKDGSEFVGREDQLLELQDLYKKGKSSVFIYGSAGYGKTELAKQFARTVIHEDNANVIFLHGDSGSKLLQGIKRISDQIIKKLSHKMEQPYEHSIAGLSEFIGSIIIIIDNVDRSNKIFDELLQSIEKDSTAFVIITTRDLHEISRGDNDRIYLDVFKRETSVQIVKNRLPDQSLRLCDQLCDNLEDWPLAIAQAISLIKKLQLVDLKGNSYGIRQYLREFRTQPSEKADILIQALRLSIQHIDDSELGKLAKTLLELLAYLDPDGVHMDTLEKVYCYAYPNQKYEKKSIEMAVKHLQSYTIVKSDNYIIHTHRMTQLILRLIFSKQKETNRTSDIFYVLVRILDKLKEDFTADETFQAIKLWEHILELRSEEAKKSYLTFAVSISNRLLQLYSFETANSFSNENIKRIVNVPGDINEMTLRLECNIYRSLNYQGNFDQIVEFKNLHTKVIKHIGEKNELGDEVNLELASMLKNKGNISEAMEKYENVFDKCRANLGLKNPLTLRARNGRAICLMNTGKVTEALEEFVEVLKDRKEVFGEKNPSYLRTLCYYGECQFKLNKFGSCKKIFTRALELQQDMDLYHPRHQLTIRALLFLLRTVVELKESEVDFRRTVLPSIIKNKDYRLSLLTSLIKSPNEIKDNRVSLNAHETLRDLMMDNDVEFDDEAELNLVKDQIRVLKQKLESR